MKNHRLFRSLCLAFVLAPLVSASGATQRQPPDQKIFHVSSNLYSLARGGAVKLSLVHVGKRSQTPSKIALYFLNERDEVIKAKTVEIGPGRPGFLKLQRARFGGRKAMPVRAVYHQPLDSKLRLALTVELNGQDSPFAPINSFEVVSCPPKAPPQGGSLIDCNDPCGCDIGGPADFLAPSRRRN